jgi:predicted nucleic acid-binding protein
MKKAVLDASSAILLKKADLLDNLIEVYHVSQTQSVLHELTRRNYYGADTFRQYADLAKIKIIDVENIPLPAYKAGQELHFLDQGELDTIICFLAGNQDFIIIDDGRAARYCSNNNIAFINALLFPRLLYLSSSISIDTCDTCMETIIQHGRYSDKVIAWAKSCKKESLLFAIPDTEEKI